MTSDLKINGTLLWVGGTKSEVTVKFSKISKFHLIHVLPTCVCDNPNPYSPKFDHKSLKFNQIKLDFIRLT